MTNDETIEQNDDSTETKLKINGQTSDGYHTFDELYKFRLMYNAALFNEWGKQNKYNVYKSIRHSDGDLCFGGKWFVVVAELPTGQISNHYKLKYWGLFKLRVLDIALSYDGHSPLDVLLRLEKFNNLTDTAGE